MGHMPTAEPIPGARERHMLTVQVRPLYRSCWEDTQALLSHVQQESGRSSPQRKTTVLGLTDGAMDSGQVQTAAGH